MVRKYQKREDRLLNEWLKTMHRGDLQWKHVRLGEHATAGEARAAMVKLQHIDAIFLHDDVVYLVEAKMRPTFSAVYQVMGYLDAYRKTPEFKDLANKKVQLMILSATHHKEVRKMCEEHGIIFTVFTPSWVQEYFEKELGMIV